MLKSMRKQRAGLLALLAAAVFLFSEVAGFVNPQEALAASYVDGNYNAEEGTVGKEYGIGYHLTNIKSGEWYTNVQISDLQVKGDLPEGIGVTKRNDQYGDYLWFSGKPVKEGEYKFSTIFYEVSDQRPDGENVRWNWTMIVNPSQDPYIATKSIKGTVSENLSAKLEAKNFDGDVTWSLTEGSSEKLKEYGLAFDNGTISGTPVKEGTFDIGVMAKGKKDGEDAAKDGTVTIKIGTKSDDDDDDDDDDHHHHEEVKWSPDALTVRYFVDGHYATNLKSGKIQQGEAAKAVFTASKPAGWTEAFSFNLSFDDKTDYTLKNGILTLYIPSDYIKAGRQYALMGMDQGGQVHIYADTDAELGTVTTAPLNLQGFAMELIYKD